MRQLPSKSTFSSCLHRSKLCRIKWQSGFAYIRLCNIYIYTHLNNWGHPTSTFDAGNGQLGLLEYSDSTFGQKRSSLALWWMRQASLATSDFSSASGWGDLNSVISSLFLQQNSWNLYSIDLNVVNPMSNHPQYCHNIGMVYYNDLLKI